MTVPFQIGEIIDISILALGENIFQGLYVQYADHFVPLGRWVKNQIELKLINEMRWV